MRDQTPVRTPFGLTTQDKFNAVMDVVVLPTVLIVAAVWFWRKR